MNPNRTDSGVLKARRPGLPARLAAWLLAVAILSGGQWFVLQSIAWARMVVVYAQTDSLGTALKKTFDGRHPCSICLHIRQAQQEEQQSGRRSPLERAEPMPELFCESAAVSVPEAPVGCALLPAGPPERYSDFVESPPTPPPRLERWRC